MTGFAGIAVAWLREEDWETWLALDDQMPSYERWLQKITSAMTAAEAQGTKAQKVEIDPAVFVQWCTERGETVGALSRSKYAAEVLMKRMSSQ